MNGGIVFACRENASSEYIAHAISSEGLLQGIVLESGVKAKQKKLRRIKAETKWWGWPVVLIDMVFLLMYQKITSSALTDFVRFQNNISGFPKGVLVARVEDINDSEALSFISQQSPTSLVVHGTAILQPDTIDKISCRVLNIHGGIVPKYRNVHSDLWAFLERDYEGIGTTIMHLDAGIDTGDVALKREIGLQVGEGLLVAKIKNLQLAANLIVEVLVASKGKVAGTAQDKSQQQFFSTPGAIHIVKAFWFSICRKISSR